MVHRCKVCNKEFTTKRSCMEHELAHEFKFTCNTCRKQYSRRSDLKRHERQSMHGGERGSSHYPCAICNAAFSSLRALRQHGHIHKREQSGGESRSAVNGTVSVSTLRPIAGDRYDLLKFLSSAHLAIRKYILSKVRKAPIKWYIVVQVELTRENSDGETITVQPYFRSLMYTLLTEDTLNPHDLNEAIQKIVAGLEKYIHESSGWVLHKVVRLDIHSTLYKPLGGSSYIDLPTTMKQSRAILNVRNSDDKCFIWAVLSHLHPVKDDPQNVENYFPYERELRMKGITYPVKLSQLRKFERQNEDISINVFGFESGEIFPLKITQQKGRRCHVNLLYLEEGGISHYCLIRDLDGFLFRTKSHKDKTYFCHYCLNGLTSKSLLQAHMENCSVNGEQKVVLPKKGVDDLLKYTNFSQQLLCPMVIYADMETVNRHIHTCSPDPAKSHTTATRHLDVCSYGYKRVCIDSRYTKDTVIYRGPDAARHFVEALIAEEEEILQILKRVEPIRMSNEEELDFINATHCSICSLPFDAEDYTKVRDHCHLTGRYRGAAHGICNLQYQTPAFIPVMFHGLRNFDGHIIMQCIGEYEKSKRGITCIPRNMESYISFSLGKLRFLDTYQFLSSSLECLTENLKATGGLANFRHFSAEFSDHDVAHLLLRKNVYPYDYMNDESRFEEKCIPPKEAFYSKLKKSNISDSDYQQACNVYTTLGLNNLGEYSDIYLKTDVLLLCDIFENFREICHRDYNLCPCHFYSAPGLSWAAMLRMTDVKLELITDIDDLLMWERGIRGGISQISHRHASANNPYLDDYDSSKPTSYISFWDCNNLYGWASRECLPIGNFRRLSEREASEIHVASVADDAAKGYLLEVSLQYPEHLHDEHNCLPLCPSKRHVDDEELSPYAKETWHKLRGEGKRAKGEKLMCTLEDKERYVLHYRYLKLCLRLGMRLTQIHSVLEFNQEPWLRKYIDFNTRKRAEANTEFERMFYKLLNNSVFGKLMECQRKHVDVSLTNSEKKLNKLTAKPTYSECRIFNESLVGVHCKRSKVILNKPLYAGQTVLDLSKVLMYEFWYFYLKRKYENQITLLMCDTDSLLFHVRTDDIYADMKEDGGHFDTSDYPPEHPLHSQANRKIPGKFKDELGGKVASRFCGLRAKMYALKFSGNELKKAKGVAKATMENDIRYEMYEDTLMGGKEFLSSMDFIRSHSHEIYCEEVTKKSLSSFDDKRYLFNDGVSSLAYGHYYIYTQH